MQTDLQELPLINLNTAVPDIGRLAGGADKEVAELNGGEESELVAGVSSGKEDSDESAGKKDGDESTGVSSQVGYIATLDLVLQLEECSQLQLALQNLPALQSLDLQGVKPARLSKALV